MAQCADDPRFVREVEGLSRVQHPSLPRLLDRGSWRSSTGAVHPYFVMEWIRGQTLYEWGRRHNPTSREVMKVMAQLAWGLETVHRAEGLHRDVRGDNILVEPNGRAVLTDLGSCTWRGAPPLTQRMMPPNTREYRSPEAVRFERERWSDKDARYEARTTDDLYALAVSMYRLLTGEYPPPDMPPARMPLQAHNPRVARELVELVERALAEEPQARGSAREIAQAADIAAERVGPEADVPLFQVQAAAEIWDGGTQGLGEEPSATREDAGEMPAASSSSVIAIEMLKQPLAGQYRPPSPRASEAINGGCWKRQPDIEPPCGAYYEWRGACYLPVMRPPRRREAMETPPGD